MGVLARHGARQDGGVAHIRCCITIVAGAALSGPLHVAHFPKDQAYFLIGSRLPARCPCVSTHQAQQENRLLVRWAVAQEPKTKDSNHKYCTTCTCFLAFFGFLFGRMDTHKEASRSTAVPFRRATPSGNRSSTVLWAQAL